MTLNEAYKTLSKCDWKEECDKHIADITSCNDLMTGLLVASKFDLRVMSDAISNLSLGLYLKEQMLKEEVKVSEANEPMP